MRRGVFALLYWLAVLLVSVALVLALLLWLESRDESSVGARAPASSARLS